jgi:hypothetical protein
LRRTVIAMSCITHKYYTGGIGNANRGNHVARRQRRIVSHHFMVDVTSSAASC